MSELYVPSEKQVREWCAEGSGEYRDIMNAWLDRFLAQVKADAARTALTECAAYMDGYSTDTPSTDIRLIRDDRYPEGEAS